MNITLEEYDHGTANARFLVSCEIDGWHVTAWVHRRQDNTYHLGRAHDSMMFALTHVLHAYKAYGQINNPSLAVRRSLWRKLERTLNHKGESMPKKKIETRTVAEQIAARTPAQKLEDAGVRRPALNTPSGSKVTPVEVKPVEAKTADAPLASVAPPAPSPLATSFRQCSAICGSPPKGHRCPRPAKDGSEFCFIHEPTRRAARIDKIRAAAVARRQEPALPPVAPTEKSSGVPQSSPVVPVWPSSAPGKGDGRAESDK